jgi:outer membrane protein assembly factor BamB
MQSMKPKHRIITIFLLILAASLSACAGGATAATSWPGLIANQGNSGAAIVAYNTQVHAVDLSNGGPLWRFPAEPDNQITFYARPALTPDGQLIVGAYNNTLYSLNPENGSENWRFTGARNRFIASPLATERGIFASNADKNVYALDFDGSLLWTFTMEAESWAQPISDPECTCLYVTSMDHRVYALDPEDGRQLWRTEDLGGAIVGTPALGEDGTLYVGTFGSGMLAINTEDGETRWQFPTEGWVWSGPSLHDGSLSFGDLNGNFYTLDAANGQSLWTLTADQLDGPIAGSPLVVDGLIYVSTESGTLFALSTQGAIEWSQAIGGKLYTSPLAADDLIIVAPIDTDELLIALTADGARRWGFNPNPE